MIQKVKPVSFLASLTKFYSFPNVTVQLHRLLLSLTTKTLQLAEEPECFSIGYAGSSYNRNIEKP